jgi:dTDP-4-dehydrorhamnose 3,5-epimerase
MKFTPLEIPDVLLVEPDVFGDARGFFTETFNAKRYAEGGITRAFVQDNFSHSRRGILRGLHFQLRRPQAKLVYVTHGEVFDVAVDIRRGSPTFGNWCGRVLSAENHHQMFIPEGFAHGFCVLSEYASFLYKCSALYDASDDRGIAWNDPDLGIAWPISEPLLSAKDQRQPRLRDVPADGLPEWA